MKRIKDNLISFIASLIVTMIPIFVGLMLWNSLPERIAVHFNINGEPDSFFSKGGAVFGVFAIMIATHLLIALYSNSGNKTLSDRLYRVFLWISPLISIALAVLIYGTALGFKVDAMFSCMMLSGVLYLILGNYVPKMQQNSVVGVRIKWTFESKKNWEHSNRFAGFYMFIIGILTIALGLLSFCHVMDRVVMLIIWTVLLCSSVIAVIVYSYVYYVRHKNDPDYFDKNESEEMKNGF